MKIAESIEDILEAFGSSNISIHEACERIIAMVEEEKNRAFNEGVAEASDRRGCC